MVELNSYVGEPLSIVKKELENKGFNVVVKKNSLPKIQTDYELVVFVKQITDKDIEVVVGDFLINIENKNN